jgi:hypothetical protein
MSTPKKSRKPHPKPIKRPFPIPILKISAIAVIVLIILVAYSIATAKPVQQVPKACPMIALLCPDGSAVGATGPNCEFAACPTANPASCAANPVSSCQSTPGCAVCPPCAACNSISCHTISFCKSIGFDGNWYEQVNPNCTCPQGYEKEGATCNPKCYYGTPKCAVPSVMCSQTG